MGSTFFSLHYHIVFSTKERLPLIKTDWWPRLHSYVGGIIRGMNGVPEIVGGVADHVHMLASLRPVHCLADLMRDLKKDSSNWVKTISIGALRGRKDTRLSRSVLLRSKECALTLPTRPHTMAGTLLLTN